MLFAAEKKKIELLSQDGLKCFNSSWQMRRETNCQKDGDKIIAVATV